MPAFAGMTSLSLSFLRQMRERGDHAFVDVALERNDQVGKLAHRHPAPLGKLRFMSAGRMRHVDLALAAGEAQRVPLLLLAAVAPAQACGTSSGGRS